jgi:anti-sigma factor RsiW
MTWTRHVRNRIAAFADAALDGPEAARVEAHLRDCAACRDALDRHQAVAALLRQMTTTAAPAGIWTSIESALDRPAVSNVAARRRFAQPPFALAAVALAVATVGVWWLMTRPAAWDVVRLDLRVAARVVDGQWVETDVSSSAAIRIGEIGRVDLAPGTRLQLVIARSDEHRLNLARGRISVEILAPPRVFFVETPASTVVDLGCAYTMEVDADGGGTLRVTQGWAALESGDRESLVPAGASARTRPSLGPGTPSFDDAADAFRRALDEFDVGSEPETALAVVLAEARQRDTLSLWHLMSRVTPAERVRVFERLVSLEPLPGGVTRQGALALDTDTMRRWREELAWTW